MVSQVLYRKWRPQTLAGVVGQEHVTRTLINALAQGRVAHAYLFCGPRGTGKTSTARILAKAVNCARNGKGEPCNECPQCLAVGLGNALDLIEIDAASNRGIDEVRDLRERVNYLPAESPFKVYIIDEVHMMTTPAFNALLKILEEPPRHVIFILATTEAHRLPVTIVSRCQRFDFRRLSQSSVEGKLQELCDDEGVKVEPWVMKSIVRASEGSLRDAENLLEQLIVSFGASIEPAHLRELLGVSSGLPLQEVAAGMLSGDLPGALRALHGVAEQGLNLKHFHREMLEYLRSVLLIKAGAADVLDLPEEELEGAREQASTSDIGLLQRALTLWSSANLKADSSSPMPLEMAIIDVALYASQPVSTPQQTRPARSAAVPEPARPAAPAPRARAAPTPAPQPPRPPVRDPDPQPVAKATSNGVSGPDTHIEEAPRTAPVSDPRPEPVSAPAPISEAPADISDFKERWPALVDALRGVGSKGSLDAVLRSASEPVALEGDTLVIGFFHEFHKNWIDNPKYRHLVEKKVNEVFGGPYRIRCDLVSKDKSPPIDSGPAISEPAPPNGGYGQPALAAQSEPRATKPPPVAATPDSGPGPLVRAALGMGARIIERGPENSGVTGSAL